MKNEQGYTLVTVLLMITISMIIFLSFVGLSYSSVKQNQVVEKNSKSVALAEMGISYYQVAVQNIYEANKQAVNDQVKATIERDRATGLKTETYYVDLGVSLMKEAIRQGLASERSSVTLEGKPHSTFSIQESNYFDVSKDKKILLKINGVENGKSTTLSTELSFTPVISGLNVASAATSSYVLPTLNTIPVPTNVSSTCKNPISFNTTCTEILIDTLKTYSDNINGLSNKIIYSTYPTGVFTINGNANNMKNMKIHTDNSFYLGLNANNASTLFLESKGNATFGSQFRIDTTSKLYIGGGLTVNGHFELAGNSIVYVGGNAVISGKLTIPSGSKMCVGGTLTVSKKQTITGDLIVKSNVSDAVFKQKCGIPSATPLDITWSDKLLNNVNYEY
ncbi:hypothetical protein [Neobacillus drentensis]|uniref:hypothetical protein n=1 Tax=Neobacillus drentensis TaxID=220684 RepID=UPI003000FD0C